MSLLVVSQFMSSLNITQWQDLSGHNYCIFFWDFFPTAELDYPSICCRLLRTVQHPSFLTSFQYRSIDRYIEMRRATSSLSAVPALRTTGMRATSSLFTSSSSAAMLKSRTLHSSVPRQGDHGGLSQVRELSFILFRPPPIGNFIYVVMKCVIICQVVVLHFYPPPHPRND